MREIKFRAFYEGKMWEVENIYIADEYISIYRGSINEAVVLKVNLSECVLMQHTGLEDKNSVEIYEGDIVKEVYYPIGVGKGVEYYIIGLIIWHDGAYGIKQEFKGINIIDIADAKPWHKECRERCVGITAGDDLIRNRFYPKELEIIGNIHNNPELLKG